MRRNKIASARSQIGKRFRIQIEMRHGLRKRSVRCDRDQLVRVRERRPGFTSLGVESSIDRGSGQSRILSLPTWAGISTLAVAPGCCGFSGPVPSATLDKRCRLKQQPEHSKTKTGVKAG